MVRGAQKSTQTAVVRVSRTAVARARLEELKAQGNIVLGRPKGVLNAKTIAKIKSKEAFDKAITERAGQLADDLLRNSQNGDTQATKVALEQAFGKPKDNSLKDNLEAAFSLLDFGRRAALLEQQSKQPIDGNKDMTVKPQVLPHPSPSSEEQRP